MDDGREIARISASTGFSEDAVRTMAEALRAGGGTMAQFNHGELGGFGQWSAGGMLMIGDMFNNQLKGRVGTLADMVSASLSSGNLPMRTTSSRGFGASGGWWPEELGQPSSSGAQNSIRYAVFPGLARLAIETNGTVTVYDTGDHQIGGVSQQQGGTSSLRFSSQLGSVEARDLKVVDHGSIEEANSSNASASSWSSSSSNGGGSTQSQTQVSGSPMTSPHEAGYQAQTLGSFAADRPSSGSSRENEGDASAKIDRSDDTNTDNAPAAQVLSDSPMKSPASEPTSTGSQSDTKKPIGDPIALLRGLAELKNEGILTEEEFASKKAELLARL